MQETGDIELLRQYAREGSEEAFAALVNRHVNLVYFAALRKTNNAQAAEEITQAVFIILAKKAHQLRRGTILSGWLYQAARLTAASFLRTELRRARREQEAYVQSLLNEPELGTWPEIAPLLEDAMGVLGEKERNAIVLRFFEGKSFQEVGAAYGASENAAKKRVARALEKLQKYFSKRGVVSTTAILAGAISTNSVQAAPVALAKSVTAMAIAKGAAASGSTLILVKGALNLMAWAKAKLAVFVSVGVLLTAGTTIWIRETRSGEVFSGTLKVVSPLALNGPQTNFYDVVLRSQPPNWELSLTSSNEHHEVFSSPKQIFEADLDDSSTKGWPKAGFIRIFMGARPLMDQPAEHVWLALLSGNTFINRQLPMPAPPGLGGIFAPCLITEANSRRADASPRQMRWISEFANGRNVRLEGEFEWLANTNVPRDSNLPTISQMATYRVDKQDKRRLTSFSELVISSIKPLDVEPRQIPRILGRTVVFDYRLCDFLSATGNQQPMQYEVKDSQGLENVPTNLHRLNKSNTY